MLINFTNHPLESWSAKQIQDAEKVYTSICDLPFPNIDPYADMKELYKFIDDYYTRIIKLFMKSENEKNAVHIMGELTFTFAMVNKLLKNNIECIASTTERLVREIDGYKVSKFEYVKFRKYELT